MGTTLTYEKIKIDAKQQEDIGKHTVVTMDLRDEKSVCTHSLLFHLKDTSRMGNSEPPIHKHVNTCYD